MTVDRDNDVQEILRSRGFALSAAEVKKVEVNYIRLTTIYDGICGWHPPTDTKIGARQ